MQPREHDGALVEVADVVARLLADREDLTDALRVLDDAEAAAGAPLVDQAERQRLERAVSGDASGGVLSEHHHAILAHRDGACVGYAGVVVPRGEEHGVGDVAFHHGQERCDDVLRALLEAVDVLVRDHDAHGTQMWIRHATATDTLAAVAAGYAVDRRLAVLGRDLPAPAAPAEPSEVDVRAATTDDVGAVVAVLAAAYRGTPEEGWDRERFTEHATQPWFRFADLLVAEDEGGEILGVHWTKRRDERTGEVYNLAVAPAGQGRGLGRRLLDAGLRHLHEVGCEDVVLWVDLANEAAVRLYTTAGFAARWEDIAFVRHARAVGRHDHAEGRPRRLDH